MKVISLLVPIALFAGVMTAATCYAQAPTGSTGECKDGTYSSAEKKRGACAGHGGVKDWYGEKKAATTPSKAPAAATPAAAAPAAATAKATAKSEAMPAAPAPGGGAGKVWVNTATNVYHCSSDKWYGKTKKGEYMSEADAKAKGNHAERGKTCS
jgi:uncharacterized protein DUF3761